MGASSVNTISHLAKLQGDGTSRPWVAPSSWMCSGSRVDLFTPRVKEADEMLDEAQIANTMQMWLIRILGIFLAFLGVRLTFSPIDALVEMVSQGLDWFSFIP